ncbi:MAG: hypothetical protein EBR82_18360 [Caulobacteraceae bacterium]|nr:hypothetical protein [Caulobacteraceae bacterium]
MIATIEIEGVPEGYEPVGHIVPNKGDLYISATGEDLIVAGSMAIGPRLVVRKIEVPDVPTP